MGGKIEKKRSLSLPRSLCKTTLLVYLYTRHFHSRVRPHDIFHNTLRSWGQVMGLQACGPDC